MPTYDKEGREERLQEAVASFKANEFPSVRQTAAHYKVTPATLARRIKRPDATKHFKRPSQRLLTSEQEAAIVKYIITLKYLQLPVSQDQLFDAAEEFSGKRPSGRWLTTLYDRNKEELKEVLGNVGLRNKFTGVGEDGTDSPEERRRLEKKARRAVKQPPTVSRFAKMDEIDQETLIELVQRCGKVAVVNAVMEVNTQESLAEST